MHAGIKGGFHAEKADAGLQCLGATAMPAIRPPPPMGTMRVSSSGAACSISNATVPWPAMMRASSYGESGSGPVRRPDARQAEQGRQVHRPPARRARHRPLSAAPWRRECRAAWRSWRNAEAAGVISDALGMVAGRDGDHASSALIGRERLHPVERTARLEGGGSLQVLQLQIDLGADHGGQRRRAPGGRALDLADNGARGQLRHRRRRQRTRPYTLCDPPAAVGLPHMGGEGVACQRRSAQRAVPRLAHP